VSREKTRGDAAREKRIELGIKSGAVLGVIETRSIADDPLATVVAVGRAKRFSCSGVLIAPALVLTAKHCLPAEQVLFGDTTEASPVIVGVSRSRAHPRLDAALLVLDTPVVAAVQRRRSEREVASPRGSVRAVGFGATDRDGVQAAGRKLFVDFTVTSWGCDGERRRVAHCDPRYDLVVPSTLGKDTCRGDSGGPVFEVHEDRWRLIALTSRSLSQRRAACGEGGIYTRVDALDRWIADVVEEEFVE
jgi:hypothetical protein